MSNDNTKIRNETQQLSQDSAITLYQISGNSSAMASSWTNDLFLVSPEESGGNKVVYVDRDGNDQTYLPVSYTHLTLPTKRTV